MREGWSQMRSKWIRCDRCGYGLQVAGPPRDWPPSSCPGCDRVAGLESQLADMDTSSKLNLTLQRGMNMQIKTLEAGIAELKKDKARIDWIEETSPEICILEKTKNPQDGYVWNVDDVLRGNLRDALDAAIAAPDLRGVGMRDDD